jgi:hypothetical protein
MFLVEFQLWMLNSFSGSSNSQAASGLDRKRQQFGGKMMKSKKFLTPTLEEYRALVRLKESGVKSLIVSFSGWRQWELRPNRLLRNTTIDEAK